MSFPVPALAALVAVLVAAAAPAPAQTADSTGAPADTTRPLISTDGSVYVYEELRPGEGLEGFWWEFDPDAELARLLDQERRGERLDPVVDSFGFELALPESIVTLRDSVAAVADSILAETLETATIFDPKLNSTYTEAKDVYTWTNELDTSVPVTRNGSIFVKATVKNDFNESTKVYKDNRDLTTTFNYNFDRGIVTSFGVTRTGNLQERGDLRESEGTHTVLSGNVRAIHQLPSVGQVEAGVGASVSRRDYTNPSTNGDSENVTPNWNLKYTLPWETGNVSLAYRGDRGRARREEETRILTDDVDENGDPIFDITRTISNENNLKNGASLAARWEVNEYSEMRLNGNFSRDSFQYLSQADSLRGLQETRRQAAQSLRLNYDTQPTARLDIKSTFEIRQSESNYDLETERFTRVAGRSGDATIVYDPWTGGKLTFKLFSQVEDKDYVSNQSGLVYAHKGSVDWEQTITENVTASAGYFVTLDAFHFDDPVSNEGDRDLKKEKGLFVVNYVPPVKNLTTALNVDIRRDQTINLHPGRSGNNREDHTFIITPTYTWKTGQASISGNFNADVRYKLYPFRPDDDELTRRFSLGQRWQHSFTEKTSTDVLWNYEFTDQGLYPRGADGKRRFARTGELRRLKFQMKLLYSPHQSLKTDVMYRRDTDDVYSIISGERQLTSEPTTTEFSFGIDLRHRFTRHVVLDLVFRQSHKEGALATAIDRRYYNIRASLKYRPFRPEKDDS